MWRCRRARAPPADRYPGAARSCRRTRYACRSSVFPLDNGDHQVRSVGWAYRQRALDLVVITAVDGRRRPAVYREVWCDTAAPAVRRRLVVDRDHGQVRQSGGAGVRDRLVIRTLVKLSVADEHEDARA